MKWSLLLPVRHTRPRTLLLPQREVRCRIETVVFAWTPEPPERKTNKQTNRQTEKHKDTRTPLYPPKLYFGAIPVGVQRTLTPGRSLATRLCMKSFPFFPKQAAWRRETNNMREDGGGSCRSRYARPRNTLSRRRLTRVSNKLEEREIHRLLVLRLHIHISVLKKWMKPRPS